MAGNFKILYQILLFGFLFSCSSNKNESVGKEIINQNFNSFLTDLPIFPSKENPDGVLPIIVSDSIKINYFINNYCREDCFDKINKEGFNINEKTNYLIFRITKLPQNIEYQKIYLKHSNKKLKINDYIEINFSNFYFNKENNKAFIIVEKDEHGSKGGKTEVYFFEKKVDGWKLYKKELLMIG
ncbi:hypothetical protein IQ37_00155 [Chryseobacterium piperi]|uniref:Lipoprotein n=1 Tax=Chryseobacterium piperi TaxID=558152 RepID=A0A086BMS1_9FLAO|nr:hypothetical protein [Chryseobacterium piperi]ASW75024.1 hypothetical protein CJF12_12555 [Chryseobacterium piperi]KFF30235.1 hypothetical protein IQ37_00155 [Chryseobacterium piperi]